MKIEIKMRIRIKMFTNIHKQIRDRYAAFQEVIRMKTADGKFRLSDIVKLATRTPGVRVESGRRHPYLLKYERANIAGVGNCALAGSTYVDRHIVPWFKQVTGYNKNRIYHALKAGAW